MKKAVLFNFWGVVVTPHLDQTFQKFEETTGLSRYVTIICFVLCNAFVFIIYISFIGFACFYNVLICKSLWIKASAK